MTLTRRIKVDIVERELEVEIEYTFHRGYRGSYIDPPESPHTEISGVTILDKAGKSLDTPRWLADLIAESEYVQDELIDYATEDC
jgi:hypothetical protein